MPGGKSSLEQGLVRFFLSSQVALPDSSLCSFTLIILKGSQSPHSPEYLQAKTKNKLYIAIFGSDRSTRNNCSECLLIQNYFNAHFLFRVDILFVLSLNDSFIPAGSSLKSG